MALKSITFSASWAEAGSYGLIKAKEVTFELGMGPCGRKVVKLECEVGPEYLKVTQWSRNPDDPKPVLEPHTEAAMEALDADRRMQYAEAERTFTLRHVKPRTTGFLWWRQTVEADVEMPLSKGLAPEQRHAFQALVRAHTKAWKDWDERLEVKVFIYKMSDVHGRIVTTK